MNPVDKQPKAAAPSASSSNSISDADRMRQRIAAAGLSQRAAARELGVDDRTLRYWCAGEAKPPEMAMRALDPRARHYAFLKRTIQSNEEQAVMLESGQMTCGYGGAPDSRSAGIQESRRLRRKNEELRVLVRVEDAFQRRQEAFFAMHAQWLPHGSGTPSKEVLDAFDAAEAEWRAAQEAMEKIRKEIQSGSR